MQNAIESALNDESYASLDQQTFYTLLISGMESSSAATTTQYGSFEIYFLSLINPIAFFKLNYILKHITLVMTRYDAVSCVAESTYTTTYNVKCLDPNRMNEAPYTTSNGVTYNYIHNPPDSVSLDVPLGHFDNSGNLFSYGKTHLFEKDIDWMLNYLWTQQHIQITITK